MGRAGCSRELPGLGCLLPGLRMSGWGFSDPFLPQYSIAGDDSVTEGVTDLVRGTLCPALKALFEHGLKKPSLLGGACHPWLFIEEVSHCGQRAGPRGPAESRRIVRVLTGPSCPTLALSPAHHRLQAGRLRETLTPCILDSCSVRHTGNDPACAVLVGPGWEWGPARRRC